MKYHVAKWVNDILQYDNVHYETKEDAEYAIKESEYTEVIEEEIDG